MLNIYSPRPWIPTARLCHRNPPWKNWIFIRLKSSSAYFFMPSEFVWWPSTEWWAIWVLPKKLRSLLNLKYFYKYWNQRNCNRAWVKNWGGGWLDLFLLKLEQEFSCLFILVITPNLQDVTVLSTWFLWSSLFHIYYG